MVRVPFDRLTQFGKRGLLTGSRRTITQGLKIFEENFLQFIIFRLRDFSDNDDMLVVPFHTLH